jgi:hypothetical protein
MVLTAKEESLVRSLRTLPREAANHVIDWTTQLAELAQGRPIEWSNSWTDEDLRDAQAASLRNFDERER